MLGFVVRRALSAAPALAAFVVGLFVLIASAPPPAGLDDEALARRFIGLPVLFNLDPRDRPRRVRDAVKTASTTDADNGTDLQRGEHARAVRTLLMIGGAGLGELVDAMAPLDQRTRSSLSVELAPLAPRLGINVAIEELEHHPETSWRQIYEDRARDLRPAAVRRALRRHLENLDDRVYETEVLQADTAALAPLFDSLDDPLVHHSPAVNREIDRLILIICQRIGAREVVDLSSAKTWWRIRRSWFIEFDTLDRVAAHATETRFGRWLAQAVTQRLGTSWIDGQPVAADLRARMPKTLARVGIAIVVADLLAFTIALFTAARRGRLLDHAVGIATIAIGAMPPAVAAILLGLLGVRGAETVGGLGSNGTEKWIVVALVVLAIGPATRQAHASFLDVAREEWVVAARARGASPARVWLVHIARAATPGLVATAIAQAPTVLGASILFEAIVRASGLGVRLIDAVRAHDVPWLMGCALIIGGIAFVALILGDVALGLFDPRTRGVVAMDLSE